MELYAYALGGSKGTTFTDADDLAEWARLENVDEYELDFSDGESWEAELFRAADVHGGNVDEWLELTDDLPEYMAAAVFFLIDHHGMDFAEAFEHMDDLALRGGTAKCWAYDMVEECYDLPEFALRYFDYEAFAHDALSGGDIVEFTFDGDDYVAEPNSV